MQIDPPPSDGNTNKIQAWLTGILLSLLLIISGWGGAMLTAHAARLAVVESRSSALERALERIEHKVDRLLAKEN